MRLVLLLLAALAAVPAGSSAGESEDLADAYMAAGKPAEAVGLYRKAITRQPSAAGLWEKYDKALEAQWLASGRLVRPSPPPVAAVAPVSASPADSVTAAGIPANPPPLTRPQAPVSSAPVPVPGDQRPTAEAVPLIYRPGERVALPEMAAAAVLPPIIDGDRFRVEEVEVGYARSGSVRVTGRVHNSGTEPLNRPVIYVAIFDKQQTMVGRGRAYLSHGTYFLPPEASEEFAVAFPTYTGPVSAYSVELVGGQ